MTAGGKLTSMLLFSNPTFSEGLNVTVRRGDKWAVLRPHEFVEIGLVSGESIGWVEIISVKIFPFVLITGDELFYEHDPSCRTYEGLLKEMKTVYPDFTEVEVVTALGFQKVGR